VSHPLNSTRNAKRIQSALGVAWGVLLVLLYFSLSIQLRNGLHWVEQDPGMEEKQISWSPEVFKAFSFGQLPMVIDAFVIRYLTQDVNTSHVKEGEHPQSFYELEVASKLDPAFFDLYYVGANYLAVVKNDGPGALSVLLRGEEFRKGELLKQDPKIKAMYWKNEWQIPLLLAYTYLFELNDLSHAAQAFETTSEIKGAPAYVTHLARRFREPDGLFEVGYKFLTFLAGRQGDPEIRDRYLEKRHSLEVWNFIHQISRRFSAALGGEAPTGERFRHFLASENLAPKDPWGGKLSFSPTESGGKIVTSTPHGKVFDLE